MTGGIDNFYSNFYNRSTPTATDTTMTMDGKTQFSWSAIGVVLKSISARMINDSIYPSKPDLKGVEAYEY